ncbi:DNA polymerase II large subunit [Candidatus Pacearchaeota archaeon CG06_land_8_20_14_3_00_35_12]|nr:MAG: DNA polymerase II large subunit [Candidatus Pacearchaeota archaeon CG06_land_8_20_14_3_00_35_12]
MQQYFLEIERKTRILYDIAGAARARGLDPNSIVEIPLAMSLAERVTGLVSVKYPQTLNSGIEKRIRELEKEFGSLDFAVAIKIAEETALEKFCKFRDQLEAIDAGIRIGLAYLTLGVISSPLEGFTQLALKKTAKGEDYFAIYYSGPIRSSGATAAALSVLLADFLRQRFGYAKYDATEQEIKRAVTEINDYHERITNLQYLPSEKEIDILVRNLPVQITGEPSEEREVSNHMDLPRIETNRLRNGFCIVLADGLLQKAPKVLKNINNLKEKGIKLECWDFMNDILKCQKKEVKSKPSASAVFMKDIVAGRPVLAYPSRPGGFRLRYGRSRISGFSAVSIHPATMVALNGFIGIGTQIRTERPGKSAAVSACSTIDGPIVKLEDDSVIQLDDFEKAQAINKQIKEIIYLGDILISYGDFLNRNSALMPQGFTEEVWIQLLKESIQDHQKINFNLIKEMNLDEAITFSENFKIPLYPKFIFFWNQITFPQFYSLISWLKKARFENKIIFPFSKTQIPEFAEGKRALELLGIEHSVTTENVVLNEQKSRALLLNLGINLELKQNNTEAINDCLLKVEMKERGEDLLKFINKLSAFEIKDKAGTFIGARMGRPEKAKLRKLTGSPNVIFPVGEEGGRLRSVNEASNVEFVKADFPIYWCDNCKSETITFKCENCGNQTKKMYYCPLCDKKSFESSCSSHGKVQSYLTRRININHLLDKAMEKLKIQKQELPPLIKGVRGTTSADHIPEHIAKGIIRAMFGLTVNKDGTIRYDCTELPLTHFKPKEIGTDIEKLKEMGYTKDIHGKNLENVDQILEIKPHDIVLPSPIKTLDETADTVLINVANFIDNLLVRFYDLKPFFNIKSKQDLVGHLLLCIAPHNSAGVVGRIIGFSKLQAILASPYVHAAMRRDCDGDEAAIMFLLDALLNFSRSFLPAHRGGTQDAPLILNARIHPGEVDDMIFDIETVSEFPLAFYNAAENFQSPSSIKIEKIKDRLVNENSAFVNLNFLFDTNDINEGITCSVYKTLATMQEKVQEQMLLCERIRAVDEADVARLVIERHLIRDIRGNLRKFSMQQFRCVKCNTKYRRPPLSGVCNNCGGHIVFTISEGTIVKYLEPAIQLAQKYNVPAYVRQSLEITKRYIESIFGKELEKQQAIQKWF